MAAEPIGPTGAYPRGRIRLDDRGELNVGVRTLGDGIFIEFGVPVAWLAMSAAEARQLVATLEEHIRHIEANGG
jgi:hypothetical protein